LAARTRDELGHSFDFAFGARAIDVAERKTVDAMINAGLFRFGFRKSDAGQFRIGECAPRHDWGWLGPPELEDRMPQDDAGMVLGQMRELVTTRGVADDVDARSGRRQSVLEHDASARHVDACGIETEVLDVRR